MGFDRVQLYFSDRLVSEERWEALQSIAIVGHVMENGMEATI
jgi:hypothetical protein